MSINPTTEETKTSGKNPYGWNYSNPDRDDYSLELVGTVVAIQEVQATKWSESGPTTEPDFWPDGNPKMNIRLALADVEGNLKTFTFRPASRKAREGKVASVHLDLFALTGNTDMANLIGHTIRIITEAPPEGFGYGANHPRPWKVELVDGKAGPFQLKDPLPEEFKTSPLTWDVLQTILNKKHVEAEQNRLAKDDIPF